MKNVYFNVCDFELIKDIIEVSSEYEQLHIVGFTTLVMEEVNKLNNLHTDIYVFQFTNHHEECEQHLSSMIRDPFLKNIQIFALLKELDLETLQLLMRYDIKNFLLEPIHVHHLMNALQFEEQLKKPKTRETMNMESMANHVLLDMGLSMHLSGFYYIKTCSLLVSGQISSKRFIVGHIYEKCAHIHNTTASRVEKAIRTAITHAFRTQPEHICIYNNKPTNSQIILYVSEKLKQYMID